MTVLIVAITHGRSKDDWYAWITDRVKNNYGYDTPSTIPQLYAQSRLLAFRASREAYDKQHRALEEKYAAQRNATPSSSQSAVSSTQARSPNDTPTSSSEGYNEIPEIKIVMNPDGSISYQRNGCGDIDPSGQLMFVNDGNDDDDDDLEEGNGGRSFFTETLGLGRAESPTRNLKAQLTEYEKEILQDHIEHPGMDGDKQLPEGGNCSSLLVDTQHLTLLFSPFLLSQTMNGHRSCPMVMRQVLQNQRHLHCLMVKLLNLSQHDCPRLSDGSHQQEISVHT
jgi:protein phosphatase 2C family protein 2/3